MIYYNISNTVINFKNFMCCAWPLLDKALIQHDWDNDPYIIEDWLSSNWLFLVIRQMPENIRINSYGDHKSTANYLVVCEAREDLKDIINETPIAKGTQLIFKGFVTKRDNGIGIYPPFDLVEGIDLCENKIYLLEADCVDFLAVEKSKLRN